MGLLNEISLLAQALSGQGNDVNKDIGYRLQQQQVVPAVRQQIPGRNSFSHSHRELRTAVRQQQRQVQQWQSQDTTSPIDALLLAAGTLAEAEQAAPLQPARVTHQDIGTRPDLDEIATQLVAAFPGFAELLHSQLQPAPAPQEPQLDAAQQALLQQLIAGVSQQQEQEEAQHRQRLSTTGNNRHGEQYALQRHQEELAILQQKQHEIQLQQQQLDALQQQMLFMQHQGTANGKIPMPLRLPASTAGAKYGSRGGGNVLGAAAAGAAAARGRTSSSRPPLQTPYSTSKMQSPACKPAATVSMAGLDAAAAAALPVCLPVYSSSAQQQRQQLRQQLRPWGLTDQRKQQQVGSDADDNMHGGGSDTDDGLLQEGIRQRQRETQRQQSQQQRRVTQDSNSTGNSTPDSSAARDMQQQGEADAAAAAAAAAAVHTAPLSRRSAAGAAASWPGPRAAAMGCRSRGAAAMQQQIEKQKQPKSHAVVFVWDVDESLVLLHSLITGSYAAAVGAADAGRLADLGRQMQALLMKLIDHRLHFKQLEDVDLVHLSDVWRLAAQYKHRQGTNNQEQHKKKHAGGKPQQQTQSHRQPNGPAYGVAASDSSDEQHQEGSAAQGAGVDMDAAAASEGSQAAGVSTAPGSSLSKAGSVEVGGSRSSGFGAAADDDGVGNDGIQGAAADRKPVSVAPAISCVVAGSPSTPPEPELVLRPYKLGPRPDVLNQLWEDIHKVYDAGSGVLPLSKADVLAADCLWEELDAATGGWLTAARRLLADLSACTDLLVTHVVVGNSQLVPLLGKLMLFRLDTVFGMSEVYSASTATKLACFKRIADKYGPRARYIVIGDGMEEEVCAEHMDWPFVKIILTKQPATQPRDGDNSAAGSRQAQQAAGSSQAAEVRLGRPRLASSCAGSSAAGGGGDDGEGSAGDNVSAIAAEHDKQDPGLAAHGTSKTVEAPGTSRDQVAPSKRFRSDGSESLQGQQPQACQGAMHSSRGVCGAGQEQPRVRVDALGSSGHTLLELTAQQLVKLAVSLT